MPSTQIDKQDPQKPPAEKASLFFSKTTEERVYLVMGFFFPMFSILTNLNVFNYISLFNLCLWLTCGGQRGTGGSRRLNSSLGSKHILSTKASHTLSKQKQNK